MDIDSDFCINKGLLVFKYLNEKYGSENCCNIITFGLMKAKMVIKDVAKALDIPFNEVSTPVENVNQTVEPINQTPTENITIGSPITSEDYKPVEPQFEELNIPEAPEAPVQILNLKNSKEMLGGCGNVVANLSTLGCKTDYIGIVGNDDDGRKISKLLKKVLAGDVTSCYMI